MPRDPLAEALREAVTSEPSTSSSADDEALLARAVDRAMASSIAVTPPPAALRALATSRSSRVRALRYALPAAAALVASAAMAAVYIQRYAPPAPSNDVTRPQTTRPPKPEPRGAGTSSPPVASETAPTISVDDLPTATASPPGPSAHERGSPEVTATPAELFRDANAARRAGEVDTAIALYSSLIARHPGSPEALAARVSLGRLLLDKRGDAAGALVEFDAYLRSSDQALAEEARMGRALVFQRQGRQEDERRAWSELLERHPDSLYASRARERLRALAPADRTP